MAELQQKAKYNQIIVGGLGRPFTLGMLYNASTDELIPGIALWDSKTLKNLTLKSPQESCNFDVSASDSTKDSSFNLNVDASLKLSFLSGLIEVGGSANYLNNQKELKNQCRVTLQYKATTHFEQLSLTADVCEKIQSCKINEKGLATHVVTAIEYGANAFFVFDSQQVESSNIQTVKGQMEATIKKIPTCEIHGEAKVELTEEEKNLVKRFSVKFFGDFLLESNPATFDAAVQTYMNLPKLLIRATKDIESVNTVPMRVWLLPLEAFNVLSGQSDPVISVGSLAKGISVGLVLEAETTLQNLADFKMRCNECMLAGAVGKFPQLHHQLQAFYNFCQYYTVELQRQMAETCPAIREGKVKESVLRSLFEERQSSPFSQEKLSMWLDDMERKVNVVQSCLDRMEGIPVLSTQAEVDRFVLAPENYSCRCYVFTSLEAHGDALLQEMGNYLKALKMGEPYVLQSPSTEPFIEPSIKPSTDPSIRPSIIGPHIRPRPSINSPWFYSQEVVDNMRDTASDFKRKNTNELQFITARNDSVFRGFDVIQFHNGFPRLLFVGQTPSEVTE